MPTSRSAHVNYLAETVLRLKPKSILDVGVGFGSKGMLFREYTDIWSGNYSNWKTQIDGIEIFSSYITKLQEHIYSQIHIGDALDIIPTLGMYDLIYAGDILEHFSVGDGVKFVQLLKEHGRNVVIATPVKVSKQGAVFGNKHEEHLSQWSAEYFVGANVNYFGNTMTVEINGEINNEPQCYYCSGMKFYGDKIPLKPYTSLTAPTLFLGLYFESDYIAFENHKGKRAVFWNGSDVLRMINNKEWLLKVMRTEATHYCHNAQLQKELGDQSIHAEIVPVFFGDKEDYKTCYKQSDRTQVFMCSHPGRDKEYGVDIVKKIATEMPEIGFHIYGVDGVNTKNLVYHGQIAEEYMDREIREYQGCLRLNAHDGMSQIVCKSMLLGLCSVISRDPIVIKEKLQLIKSQKDSFKVDTKNIMDMKNIHTLIDK